MAHRNAIVFESSKSMYIHIQVRIGGSNVLKDIKIFVAGNRVYFGKSETNVEPDNFVTVAKGRSAFFIGKSMLTKNPKSN